MDSPSAQIADQSIIDFDENPPSSPFVSQVEAKSRATSMQVSHEEPKRQTIQEEEHAPSSLLSPQKVEVEQEQEVYEEDKENMPQNEPTLAKMFASPKKAPTPEPVTAGQEEEPQQQRRGSDGSSMMPPPPSARKAATTPRKSPLKVSRSAANTPKTVGRNDSFDHTTPQSASRSQLERYNSAEDQTNIDDTGFSAFSEIPEMTTFAKLGQSTTKRGSGNVSTPKETRNAATTPHTSRKRSSPSDSPSPTPRRMKTPATVNGKSDENTSFLIDFTQQFDSINSYRPTSPTKSSTESNLLQYINNQRSPQKGTNRRQSITTPQKSHKKSSSQNNILNLLDFELPPAPTPRSVPTITVRELESLKSTYQSQISSLKATLSGREAEVESFKRAVQDAERRCGEAQESVREERGRREHAESEKEGWERQGREIESVLRNVREEVIRGEEERENVAKRLEEVEAWGKEAEERAQRAEERFADALAARGSGGNGEEEESVVEERVQRLVTAQIDSKIEAVSRELHGVYKEKHERKVATLKKSYEARGEKKASELQKRVVELERANEDLAAAKDATFSGPVGGAETSMMGTGAGEAELKAQLEEQKAHLARLASEMQTSQQQQEQLLRELKQERIEKGDLVAAVDEMLALQPGNNQGAGNANVQTEDPAPATPAGARAMVEDFRKSIGRSGLKAPGAGIGGESKIGRSGLPAPGRVGSGGVGKSRMLANIERMGRTTSRDGAE